MTKYQLLTFCATVSADQHYKIGCVEQGNVCLLHITLPNHPIFLSRFACSRTVFLNSLSKIQANRTDLISSLNIVYSLATKFTPLHLKPMHRHFTQDGFFVFHCCRATLTSFTQLCLLRVTSLPVCCRRSGPSSICL